MRARISLLVGALLLLAAGTARAQFDFPPRVSIGRVQSAGTDMLPRFKLNFTGLTVTDDAANNRTTIAAPANMLTCTPTATGDICYSTSGTSAMTPLADVAAGSYLRSGGVATAALWSTLTLPNTMTAGDLMVATATSVAGSVADVATGQVLTSGGVGVVPAYSANPTVTTLTGSTSVKSPLFDANTAAALSIGSQATTVTIQGTASTNTVRLVSAAGASTGGVVATDDITGSWIQYGSVNNRVKVDGAKVFLLSKVTNVAGSIGTTIQNNINCSAAGCAALQVNFSGTASLPGVTNYGQASGVAGINCTVAEQVVNAANNTLVAGQAVVWTGQNTVDKPAATNNLTTIAGIVIVGGVASATVTICKHGRVMALSDAGVTAGQLVGTSSAVAGNVQSGTVPGAGAILGRATESTANSVAGQVAVDLNL